MKVTSFYPGPATIHPSIPSLVKDAYEIGILSANHRSPDFMELSFAAKSQLRSQLNVPDDYDIILFPPLLRPGKYYPNPSQVRPVNIFLMVRLD